MLQQMDKDLFEIFPDLPSPRGMRPPVRQVVPSVRHPLPPTTQVTRRGSPAGNRETEILALRRLHHNDDVALRRIRRIAQVEHKRLKENDRFARMLRTIIAVADAAIVIRSS
jgi:hypothetical protein